MNARVQRKINEIKKLSGQTAGRSAASHRSEQRADGLSMAIRSKRDAETFLSELNAIKKKK